jgi:dihydrodipicolinate synthase/N-acetylneuraminate lyase
MFSLSGVVPPMITPFDEEGNLDLAGLEKLLDYLKDRVHGLYICGSYRSGPLMNVEERKRVAGEAVRVVRGKIPVIVHTDTTNTRDTVALTRHALEIGCDGAAAVGSYNFHRKEDSVLAFYSAMLEIRGIVTAYPRSPFVPATKQENERIEKALFELADL